MWKGGKFAKVPSEIFPDIFCFLSPRKDMWNKSYRSVIPPVLTDGLLSWLLFRMKRLTPKTCFLLCRVPQSSWRTKRFRGRRTWSWRGRRRRRPARPWGHVWTRSRPELFPPWWRLTTRPTMPPMLTSPASGSVQSLYFLQRNQKHSAPGTWVEMVMRSCGCKRELFKACHKATVWLFFFFFCRLRNEMESFCFLRLTLAACLGENQGKNEVWILKRLPFSFLFGNNSLEGLAENVGARIICLLTVWPNLSRRTIELLGIAFTEARLRGKLVRLWDGTKPHGLDGLSAWGGGTCTTCQQSSGSDSLRRMCFWHSSGPYARPLQIANRNRWDSIPSVSICPAGTTSYKKGCCCFLCSYQQWWCQYIHINHQIITFIFLEFILLVNWISLLKALIFSKC